MSRYNDICRLIREADNAIREFAQVGSDLAEKAIHYEVERLLEIESCRSGQLEKILYTLQMIASLCEERDCASISEYAEVQGLSDVEQAHVQHLCNKLKDQLQYLQERNMDDMLHILAARQVAHSLLAEAGLLNTPATYGPLR